MSCCVLIDLSRIRSNRFTSVRAAVLRIRNKFTVVERYNVLFKIELPFVLVLHESKCDIKLASFLEIVMSKNPHVRNVTVPHTRRQRTCDYLAHILFPIHWKLLETYQRFICSKLVIKIQFPQVQIFTHEIVVLQVLNKFFSASIGCYVIWASALTSISVLCRHGADVPKNWTRPCIVRWHHSLLYCGRRLVLLFTTPQTLIFNKYIIRKVL